MRTQEFVGRAREEVSAEFADIDGAVGGVVNAVDVEQCAGGVRTGGNGSHVGHRADQIGCGRDRDQARARAQLFLDAAHRQFGGRGIEVRPPDDRACAGCGDRPRPDVGVVVQPRHDDLIARAPLGGQCPRQIEGERGHAPPEDHLVGIGVEQIADRAPALHDDLFGVACRGRGVSAVRQRPEQRVADGVCDRSGCLRAPGPVEVGGAVIERRKLLADHVDVERRFLSGIVGRAVHG